MRFRTIIDANQLSALVEEVGFLPLFANEIPGYSVEECTPKEYWFVDEVDGPWQWKEQLAASAVLPGDGAVIYGKLLGKRAAFISKEWYPVLANYRRDGYDFDALYEDGKASQKAKQIIDYLLAGGNGLSLDLKNALNYRKGGNTGFETVITQLQMQTYLGIRSFEKKISKSGKEYGWGIARYDLTERLYGEALIQGGYQEDPVRSKERILQYLTKLLKDADVKQLERMIR